MLAVSVVQTSPSTSWSKAFISLLVTQHVVNLTLKLVKEYLLIESFVLNGLVLALTTVATPGRLESLRREGTLCFLYATYFLAYVLSNWLHSLYYLPINYKILPIKSRINQSHDKLL